MAITAINLVWITVSNLEKAEHFFVHDVGLTLTLADKKNGWLEFSAGRGFRLGVSQWHRETGCCGEKQEPHCRNEGPGSNATITMDVDNLVETKNLLESRGVQFLGPIMEMPGHLKLATFADPDGNTFQLLQLEQLGQ